MFKMLNKIFNFLKLNNKSTELFISDGNNVVTLIKNDQRVPITISINNNTIEIQTPLNIVVNSELFAIKTSHGIHLNPATTNCEELERFYLQQQHVIEHTVEQIDSKLPYKLKAKRFNKFLKGR